MEAQMRTMEGVTGVIRTADNVVNVHSGNQVRFTIDMSDQVARAQDDTFIEWKAEEKLNAEEADPFLSSRAGVVPPWGSAAAQRSTGGDVGQQAVAEPSSAVNVVGGAKPMPSSEDVSDQKKAPGGRP